MTVNQKKLIQFLDKLNDFHINFSGSPVPRVTVNQSQFSILTGLFKSGYSVLSVSNDGYKFKTLFISGAC